MSIFESDKQRIIYKLKCALREAVDTLGQAEAAKICKTSQPSISRALNPEYKPKIDTLFRWLDLLGFKLKFEIIKD